MSDEELGVEIGDHLLGDDKGISDEARETRRMCLHKLSHLQGEFVKSQGWAIEANHRSVVIFEGCGATNKGGAIERIT